jgi:hypothetical protein
MNQPSLFHEDALDALRADVQALGGYKKVAHALRPELAIDKAGEWLADCLNRTRAHKLDVEQVQWIVREARKIGSFCYITWSLRDAGFEDPKPIEPEDERAALMRQFNVLAGDLKGLLSRIDRLDR